MFTRCIEYAYPSSPLAYAFGYAASGCYVVTIKETKTAYHDGAEALDNFDACVDTIAWNSFLGPNDHMDEEIRRELIFDNCA